MKRIAFCFDGTWNKLNAKHATNVVLIAESIFPSADNISQIIHYDDGVGTGGSDWAWKTFFDKVTGGIFGWGLLDNIREAYRFLIFNYEPGDEIYVFGFSRGAYTARAFVGLLRCASILARESAGQINNAIDFYQNRMRKDAAHLAALKAFRETYAVPLRTGDDIPGDTRPRLTVRYVGIWDTVGALGLPEAVPGAKWFNRRHQFYDTELPDFVESARHAVALDERRRTFPPTLWDNVDERNGAKGSSSEDKAAPIQQQWFPGSHGSVGGGGEIRGLSDAALAWIVQGAKRQGLKLDTRAKSVVYTFQPDHRASLFNTKAGPDLMTRLFPKRDRIGPGRIHEVHVSARRRWFEDGKDLQGQPYRPGSLERVKADLDLLTEYRAAALAGPKRAVHKVERNETLATIAARYYGDSSRYRLIFEANRHLLDDPDTIYVGDELVIPEPPPSGGEGGEDQRP